MKVFGKTMAVLAGLLLAVSLVSLLPSDRWFIRTIDLVRGVADLSFRAAGRRIPVREGAGSMDRGCLPCSRRGYQRVADLALLAARVHADRRWQQRAGRHPVLLGHVGERQGQERRLRAHGRPASAIRSRRPVPGGNRHRVGRGARGRSCPVSARGAPSATPRLRNGLRDGLPLRKVNIVENTYRDTPTLYATIQPRGARPIEFIGLHPKPPLPGWNTEMRDRNIVQAGLQTPDRLPDAFVMGDFNDVPWSRTTNRFRETGRWHDPRIGRGTRPTFPAEVLWLGWPLDQFMVKGDLHVAAFDVLPPNGSDHRALLARLCPGKGA